MNTRDPRPLRVLHMLPDLAVGGGQAIVLNIVAEPHDGVQHHVCALGDGPMRSRFDAVGVPVTIVDYAGRRSLPRCARRVAALISAEQIDVVHTNNTPLDRLVGQLAAARARRPVVNTFMAIATSHRPRQAGEPLPRFLRRRAGNLANRALARWNVRAFVGLSDSVGRSHAQALGLDTEDIDVVRPGLTSDAFEAVDDDIVRRTRRVLGIDGAYPVLVSVGRLDENKAQTELPSMMRLVLEELPDAHLLIVGDGDTRPAVEREVARAGIGDRVHLLGQRDDVPVLLAASDIFVSTAHNEGFGMAALEAMAASTVVVSYANPNVAIGEFVPDGEAGALVVDNSPPALAEAVVKVARSRDQLETMGQRAAQEALRYTITETVEQLHHIYARAVDDNG
jgi:glycosyltransferase involved in cell wall biosynthesis